MTSLSGSPLAPGRRRRLASQYRRLGLSVPYCWCIVGGTSVAAQVSSGIVNARAGF